MLWVSDSLGAVSLLIELHPESFAEIGLALIHPEGPGQCSLGGSRKSGCFLSCSGGHPAPYSSDPEAAFPPFRMYKYTSSRFKTRAEQEVKKAEHVARIGNVPLCRRG